MIYRCVTGKLPYVRETSALTLLAHVNADVPVPSEAAIGIPKPIDEIVERCMQKNPDDRASSAVNAVRTCARQLGQEASARTSVSPSAETTVLAATAPAASQPLATAPATSQADPTDRSGGADAPSRPRRKRLALLGLALFAVAAAGVALAIVLPDNHHAQTGTAAALRSTHAAATPVSLTHTLAGSSGQAYCVEQALAPATGTLSRQQAEAICSCDISKERAAGFHTFEQVTSAHAAGNQTITALRQRCASLASQRTQTTATPAPPTTTTAVTVTHTAVTTTNAVPNTNAKPLDAVYCDQNDQHCADVLSSNLAPVPAAPSGYDATRNCYWVNEGYNASLGETKHFCFPAK